MLDLYFLQEYFISDKIYSFKGLIFDNYEKLMKHTIERFNSSNIYEVKEEGSKESFIKSCSDERRIFYVKKLN